MTRLLPPITGNRRGIYGGGAEWLFFPLFFSHWLERLMSACRIETYQYCIETPTLLLSLAALPVVAAAPGRPQTSTLDTPHTCSFFFPEANLTHFTREAPQKCSQRLFNHSAQIIQRVSPQVSASICRRLPPLLFAVLHSISSGFPP